MEKHECFNPNDDFCIAKDDEGEWIIFYAGLLLSIVINYCPICGVKLAR